MKKSKSDQLMRPSRDIIVFTMVRTFFYMRFLLKDSCGVFTPTTIKYEEEKDLTRQLFSSFAHTFVDDDLQKRRICKYCLEAMPVTSNEEELRVLASVMDIGREFVTATRIYRGIIGAETFQDDDFVHELYYDGEERTVDLHDALISIVLCIFYPFALEGMDVNSMNDKAMRTLFHRITGKALEDALSIIYGTFHTKTGKQIEDWDNGPSLYDRIKSSCPDSLTKDFTLYVIERVFHFVIKGTKEKDISYFYDGYQS